MTHEASHIRFLSEQFAADNQQAELLKHLQPKMGAATRLPTSPSDRAGRWEAVNCAPTTQDILDHDDDAIDAANIENRLGRISMPLGLAGPLRVNGINAQGDYWLPLATTEAALTASVHRGCSLLTRSGGATTLTLAEGVSRSPVFIFASVIQAGQFALWVSQQEEALQKVTNSTTRHGRFDRLQVNVEGNTLYLILTFTTGDAAGQNMVTIAADAICRDIIARSPIAPKRWYVEGNASGDKKATAQSFQGVRGRKVCAEATLKASHIQRYLHTTAQDMEDYWRCSSMGSVLTGSIGIQGHYANVLAALFIATGQDAACVSEAAVGITRFAVTEEGDLYTSVTLPNVIVGTVGGGTGLPSQHACLDLMGLAGTGKARALAEVCAAAALAGELSIIGALAAGDFTEAHRSLARDRRDA